MVMKIKYFSSKEIFLYNGEEIIQLTDNDALDKDAQIFGNNVVWESTESHSDSEIFLYNGKEIIQLTDNDVFDESPQISGNNVVWFGGINLDKDRPLHDGEIFLYNGQEIVQLTDNDVPDLFPKINENTIVWRRENLPKNGKVLTSVMLATLDDTDSSSIPHRDRVAYLAGNRNQKLVTSSTIIILGLIFLVWLTRLC